MSPLDLTLGIAAIAAFAGGYRSGLLVRALSWAGLGLGLVLASLNLAAVRRWVSSTSAMPEALLLGVILAGAAVVGKFAGYLLGRWIRHRVAGPTVVRADRFAGAAVGVLGVACTFWVMRPLLALVPGWPSEITRDSAIADVFSRTLPDPPAVLQSTRRALSAGVLPQISDLARRSEAAGEPPLAPALDSATMSSFRRHVVRVKATACGVTSSGTGWVSDRGEITTAAHVVAGSRTVVVTDDDGRIRAATVASFDPSLDIARLSVDTGGLPVASMGTASRGSTVGVFGFPKGGALRIADAGVQAPITARGRDIYDGRDVERALVVLAADLAPGDSGAPVVDADGTVVATVIAIAPDRASTGYAVPATAVALREQTPPGRCLLG